MKWITREKVHVDRVACPWLIKNFVDKEAEFIFVPRDTNPADIMDGIPFDMQGVELGHHGTECSFDAIIHKYALDDHPVLAKMQEIIRLADTDRETENPLSFALDIFATGYRLSCKDDLDTLEKEFYLYDALFAYFKSQLDS
jgi:hypothetical protein